MSDQCRSCGAEVIFVPSAKTGKPMILDAKPEKRIVIVDVAGYTDGEQQFHPSKSMPAYQAQAKVVNAYVDHHATCPKAEQWKGRTR